MPNFGLLNEVDKGHIINAFVADSLEDAKKIGGNLSVVELPDDVSIGHVYDGVNFTLAPKTEPVNPAPVADTTITTTTGETTNATV